MKDVLKMMRFDFLTVKSMSMTIFIAVVIVCFLVSLFFSPVICSYISFGVTLMVFPLQGVADKSNFDKLYGILPVDRKTITRSRFLYIFTVFFIAELLEIILSSISNALKLYTILPNQKGEMVRFVKESFDDRLMHFLSIFGIFAVFCLMFAYLQMMGQIFGKENEFKIIIVTVGVVVLLIFTFLILSDRNIIPTFKLPNLPSSTSARALLAVLLNIVMLGICMLFGEITANKMAKREL